MDHVLKKKIDYQWFVLILSGVFLISAAFEEGSPFYEFAPYFAGFIILLDGTLLFLDVRKPAASISGDVLTIYSRYGQASVIEKSKVQKFQYNLSTPSHHEIYVEIDGYQPWTINVTEKSQHIENKRLYHFINNHFWELIPNKKSHPTHSARLL